jgi:hypothetical protein
MSAKKKRQDAFKAKEKKQKIIVAIGGVLLLGLLAFQVPRVMKQMNRGSAQAAVPKTVSTSTTGSTAPTLEAPTTLGGQEPASAASGSSAPAVSGSGLITNGSDAATQGQLASFSRFESKDPFSQQIKDSETSSSSSSSSSSEGSGSKSDSSGTSNPGSGSTASQPSPGSAVLSVNGTLMSVSVGTDFPAGTPFFHLVSLTSTTAKIAIAGGSYTSGAATVTLRVNKPVTLMNTADGSRFKVILKPQGTPVPGEGDTTSTTPTVTLPAPTP